MSKERLQEIAKELANNANMPYCWEDIYNRLNTVCEKYWN